MKKFIKHSKNYFCAVAFKITLSSMLEDYKRNIRFTEKTIIEKSLQCNDVEQEK